MKGKCIFLFSILTATLNMPTFAAGSSGAVKITSISVEGGQGVFINVDPRWSLADCGATNTYSGNTDPYHQKWALI
jgi:hypothetical protein